VQHVGRVASDAALGICRQFFPTAHRLTFKYDDTTRIGFPYAPADNFPSFAWSLTGIPLNGFFDLVTAGTQVGLR
jgi:hypothetical protein